ncbi:hypothetical protein ACMUBP_004120, partial [Cronobacter sakazakii]
RPAALPSPERRTPGAIRMMMNYLEVHSGINSLIRHNRWLMGRLCAGLFGCNTAEREFPLLYIDYI